MIKKSAVAACMGMLYFLYPVFSQEATVVTVMPPVSCQEDVSKGEDVLADISAVLSDTEGLEVRQETWNTGKDAPAEFQGRDDSTLFADDGPGAEGYILMTEIIHGHAEAVTGGDADEPAAVMPFGVRIYLYSRSERSYVYVSLIDEITTKNKKETADVFAGRLRLFLAGRLPVVRGLTAKADDKNMSITWSSPNKEAVFEIQRSLCGSGPFTVLGKSESTTYDDTEVKGGTVYFYRVRPFVESIPGEYSCIEKAYVGVSLPRSEDINVILLEKDRPMPQIPEKEKKYVQRDMEVMKPFYSRPFNVFFILEMVKFYINKYNLTVLRGTDEYVIDRARKTIYIIHDGRYIIKFFSGRLFRFYNRCPATSEPLVITFGSQGNAGTYILEGWKVFNENMSLATGSASEIMLPVKKNASPLELNLYMRGVFGIEKDGTRRMRVSVNSDLLTELDIGSKGRYRILIPPGYFTEDGTATIRFDFPDMPGNSGSANEKGAPVFAVDKLTLSRYDREHDLFRRLMGNSIAFTAYRGEKEIVLPDGEMRVLPEYEASGLAVEYFKDLREWKKQVILFGTSDKDMNEKIREEQRRLQEQMQY